MKAIEKAQAIYDLTMNERCEAKVQDLFSNGLHKLMIDLIEELEELENRSCENCKYWFYKTLETNIETCNFGLISHDYESDSFCCNKWEAKNENL